MKWFYCVLYYYFSHYCFFDYIVIALSFSLPIDAFCEYIPARTSVQALGLLYRMAQTEVLCDTGYVIFFCRMVQPNVNIRQLDMSQMTDRDDVKSFTNAIMMDATEASETIPNLDAKFSFLPYKFCDDGPAPDKARLFSCMPFVHDGIIHKDVQVPFYAGQTTKEDIEEFVSLFKIKGHADGAMQAIQLFLQKYNQMKGREGWDGLAEDVDCIGSIDDLPLCDLQYKLAVHVQHHTTMGVMSTNGRHPTGKGILMGENWKETTENHFVEDPNELRQDVSDQLQVPLGIIFFQPVTVNIHYPKSCVWTEDVIAYLKGYSAAEDKQGGLQVLCDWKDVLQSAISSLTAEDDVGVWNWDENHYWNIKMFPLSWRTLLRAVYKTIGKGSPARDYILTGLYANQDQLRAVYGKVPGVIDNYVETIFSDVQKIQKSGKKLTEMTVIPHHDYPEKMIPLVRHHYSEKYKFFSLENITHYV
jgi:hypothetical protein